MKWNTTRLNQPFTWYSADVIEAIKEICLNQMQICNCKVITYKESCRGCESNEARKICSEILKIIVNEDKKSCKY